MTTRELMHPLFHFRHDREGVRVTLYIPGSRFGPVEFVLSPIEWERFRTEFERVETAT